MVAIASGSELQLGFRAAAAIGDRGDRLDMTPLAELAIRWGDDPWMRAAILSSPPSVLPRVIESYLNDARSIALLSQENRFIEEAMAVLGASGEVKTLATLIEIVERMDNERHPGVRAFWRGLLNGVRRSGKSLQSLFNQPDSVARKAIDRNLKWAFERLEDPSSDESTLLLAIDWLAHGDYALIKNRWTPWSVRFQNQAIQTALVNTLSRFREPDVAKLLLDRWRQYTPAVRETVLASIFARRERILTLLEEVRSGQVPPSTIDAARRTVLLTHKDSSIADQAKSIFTDGVASDRASIVDRYRPAAAMQGDAARGTELFKKHCAACHRWRGSGIELGLISRQFVVGIRID